MPVYYFCNEKTDGDFGHRAGEIGDREGRSEERVINCVNVWNRGRDWDIVVFHSTEMESDFRGCTFFGDPVDDLGEIRSDRVRAVPRAVKLGIGAVRAVVRAID